MFRFSLHKLQLRTEDKRLDTFWMWKFENMTTCPKCELYNFFTIGLANNDDFQTCFSNTHPTDKEATPHIKTTRLPFLYNAIKHEERIES